MSNWRTKVRTIIALAIGVCLSGSVARAKYGGGNGTAADPYQISTAEHMQEIGLNQSDWKKHFRLMNDINLSQYTGDTFNTIGEFHGTENPQNKAFTGVFDGNGCAIYDFNYACDGVLGVGIFSSIGSDTAQIKNLILVNPTVHADNSDTVGALVGFAQNGQVDNCQIIGADIMGKDSVGGLAGKTYQRTRFYDCKASGIVRGQDYVGGLTGYCVGEMVRCHSTCDVSGRYNAGGLIGLSIYSICWYCSADCDVQANTSAGGLIGKAQNDSEIYYCYSTGHINGTNCGGLVGVNEDVDVLNSFSSCWVSGGNYAGGLIGDSRSIDSVISNCYATGRVEGNYGIGGLVGQNKSLVSDCFSSGYVTGNADIGGLVGRDVFPSSVISSFWDIETSGEPKSAGGIGKTTAEMQTESTFTDAGWDFVGEVINGPNDIWDICEGTNYPKFVWQIPVGDFVCPDGVSLVDFSYIAAAWYSEDGDGNWDPNCDISDPNDNIIDERDLRVFVDNYLEGI